MVDQIAPHTLWENAPEAIQQLVTSAFVTGGELKYLCVSLGLDYYTTVQYLYSDDVGMAAVRKKRDVFLRHALNDRDDPRDMQAFLASSAKILVKLSMELEIRKRLLAIARADQMLQQGDLLQIGLEVEGSPQLKEDLRMLAPLGLASVKFDEPSLTMARTETSEGNIHEMVTMTGLVPEVQQKLLDHHKAAADAVVQEHYTDSEKGPKKEEKVIDANQEAPPQGGTVGGGR